MTDDLDLLVEWYSDSADTRQLPVASRIRQQGRRRSMLTAMAAAAAAAAVVVGGVMLAPTRSTGGIRRSDPAATGTARPASVSASDVALAQKLADNMFPRSLGTVTGAGFVRTTLGVYVNTVPNEADGISGYGLDDAVLVVEIRGHLPPNSHGPLGASRPCNSAQYVVYDVTVGRALEGTSISEPIPGGFPTESKDVLEALGPQTPLRLP